MRGCRQSRAPSAINLRMPEAFVPRSVAAREMGSQISPSISYRFLVRDMTASSKQTSLLIGIAYSRRGLHSVDARHRQVEAVAAEDIGHCDDL